VEHSLRMQALKEAPVYAQVDLSKKMKNRLPKETPTSEKKVAIPPEAPNSPNNYMNIRFEDEEENYKRLSHLNYMNLEFTNSLVHYENVRELLNKDARKERIDSLNIDLPVTKFNCVEQVCCKCGHVNETKDTMTIKLEKPKPKKISYLATAAVEPTFGNYNSDAVPMSPLKLQNIKLSPEKSASNPILSESSVLEKQCKTSLGLLSFNKYSTLDNKRSDRRRSSSTYSPKASKENAISDSRVPQVDSDSGLESDKLSSQENDDTLENLRHRKESSTLAGGSIRRLSSIACKSSNRDSSSSNDSGFSSTSHKYRCQDFTEFEMPLTTSGSAKRHNSFNQHCHKNGGDRCSPIPRRTKSSDPLRDLSFQFLKGSVQPKSSSAEAELPLYLNKRDLCKGRSGLWFS